MKGIVPIIAIAAVAAIALVVGEGLILNTFIGSSVNQEEFVKEMEVVKAVNTVESIKRGLPDALYYSFAQGAYQVLLSGGYDSTDDVQVIDSIPVWKKGGETFYPDYSSELSSAISRIFGEYRRSSEDVSIPAGEMKINLLEEKAVLSFSSSGLLSYKSDFVKIYDSPNATVEIKTKVKKMFNLGKQIADRGTACGGSKSYDENGLNVQIVESDSNALVKIRDSSNLFPVYDGQQAYKNLVLQFYVSC